MRNVHLIFVLLHYGACNIISITYNSVINNINTTYVNPTFIFIPMAKRFVSEELPRMPFRLFPEGCFCKLIFGLPDISNS